MERSNDERPAVEAPTTAEVPGPQHPDAVGVSRDMNAVAAAVMRDFDTSAAQAVDVGAVVAAFYDRHQKELFTFALRSCRDREAAEDLLHEAFVRLIVEVEAGRLPDNVRAWLYRVTANLVASRGRRATVARRWLASAAAPDRVVHGPEPSYLEQERRDDLDVALGDLGADARTALLMAAEGFRGEEIATAIGRSAVATRTLMCRARLQLRERLGSMESWA
jgi:RNA polymerase sigma-70 factor (ECF subfamily)